MLQKATTEHNIVVKSCILFALQILQSKISTANNVHAPSTKRYSMPTDCRCTVSQYSWSLQISPDESLLAQEVH